MDSVEVIDPPAFDPGVGDIFGIVALAAGDHPLEVTVTSVPDCSMYVTVRSYEPAL